MNRVLIQVCGTAMLTNHLCYRFCKCVQVTQVDVIDLLSPMPPFVWAAENPSWNRPYMCTWYAFILECQNEIMNEPIVDVGYAGIVSSHLEFEARGAWPWGTANGTIVMSNPLCLVSARVPYSSSVSTISGMGIYPTHAQQNSWLCRI